MTHLRITPFLTSSKISSDRVLIVDPSSLLRNSTRPERENLSNRRSETKKRLATAPNSRSLRQNLRGRLNTYQPFPPQNKSELIVVFDRPHGAAESCEAKGQTHRQRRSQAAGQHPNSGPPLAQPVNKKVIQQYLIYNSSCRRNDSRAEPGRGASLCPQK